MDDMEMYPALAAAMGFSSFGVTKKRKYNHNDAVVDAPSAPKKESQAKAPARGANSVTLAKRTSSSTHRSEKVEATGYDVPAGSKSLTQASPNADQHSGLLACPASFDKSSLPAKPSTAYTSSSASHESLSASASASASQGQQPMGTGKQLSQAELQALRHGVRNERGDMVYFLPSFIEDPWADLRKGE